MRQAIVIINIVGLVVCGILLTQGIAVADWSKVTIGTIGLLANIVSLTNKEK